MQRYLNISTLVLLTFLLGACTTTTAHHAPRKAKIIVHKQTPPTEIKVVYEKTEPQPRHRHAERKQKTIVVKQPVKKKVVIYKEVPTSRKHKTKVVAPKGKGHDVHRGQPHRPGSHRPEHVIVKEKPSLKHLVKRKSKKTVKVSKRVVREKSRPQVRPIQHQQTIQVSFTSANTSGKIKLQLRERESMEVNVPNGGRYKVAYRGGLLTIKDLKQKKWQKQFQKKGSWAKGETYLLSSRDHGQKMKIKMTVKTI